MSPQHRIPSFRRRPFAVTWLMSLIAALGFATVAFAATACGDDDESDIEIVEPSARAAESGNSAVYFTIKNGGEEDRLISATSDASAEVQLHETTIENGTASMAEVEGGIEVPEDGEVVLEPGGLHVMLLDLTAPLAVDDEVEVVLTFEKAGEITVTAPVRELPGMSMGTSMTDEEDGE